jgi:hypothetical protein
MFRWPSVIVMNLLVRRQVAGTSLPIGNHQF